MIFTDGQWKTTMRTDGRARGNVVVTIVVVVVVTFYEKRRGGAGGNIYLWDKNRNKKVLIVLLVRFGNHVEIVITRTRFAVMIKLSFAICSNVRPPRENRRYSKTCF